MSKFQQKIEAQTRQIIGQMLGDQLLVEEGKEQERQATEPGRDRHDHSGQEYETKAAKK
jgi:imidazoleglycerol phosphate synthase glutamine amidotransferase subunit HisH